MRTVEYAGDELGVRSHPWTDSGSDASFRYYDLKASPERIRTSLEDLRAWDHHAAVDAIYVLLERINAPGAIFESNDTAFTGPRINDVGGFAAAQALQCSGRLMILYRALAENLSLARMTDLKDRLHLALQTIDPDLTLGILGTTITPVRYLALGRNGYQLMISFWAWGDTEIALMENLARVVKNLSEALAVVGSSS